VLARLVSQGLSVDEAHMILVWAYRKQLITHS
jgi:hypothetical protein